MMVHPVLTFLAGTAALESRTGRRPRMVSCTTLGTGDRVDIPRGFDFSSWEHMLADRDKERQERVGDGARAVSLVKSRL
jgi:hypothetical protein